MFLPNNYSFVSILCEGGSGTLMICEDKQSNKQCVAKLMSFENKRSKQSFKNEVEILEELKGCPNIINIVEHESHSAYGCIILPRMKCDLMDILESVEKFEEKAAKGIFYQICLAVKACHDHDIAHLDIKPENILHSYEGNFYLADFGGARKIFDPNYEVENIMITRAYSAPELRNVGSLQIQPLAADIWSLGIVLFSLLTGAWPFTNIDSLTPDTPVTFVHPFIPPQVESLLRDIFQRDPAARPNIDQILAHPWFVSTTKTKRCRRASFLQKLDFKNTIDSLSSRVKHFRDRI